MMKNNRIFCVLVFGIFLVACDSKVNGNNAGLVANPISEKSNGQAKSTAIYLPGEVGLDFGRSPSSDVVREDKVSKIRIVTYEFAEKYTAIDQAITAIVEPAGYVRKADSSGENKLSVTYYVNGGSSQVLFRYGELVQEGFNKKTTLTISWRF